MSTAMSENAVELLKEKCTRYTNGHCSSRRCVLRGMKAAGATFPLADYAISTCEHYEAVVRIEALEAALRSAQSAITKCLAEGGRLDGGPDADWWPGIVAAQQKIAEALR